MAWKAGYQAEQEGLPPLWVAYFEGLCEQALDTCMGRGTPLRARRHQGFTPMHQLGAALCKEDLTANDVRAVGLFRQIGALQAKKYVRYDGPLLKLTKSGRAWMVHHGVLFAHRVELPGPKTDEYYALDDPS